MESRGLVPGRKHAPESLGAVLVLGLGKSGRAAARYLVEDAYARTERVHVAGGAGNPEARAFADGLARRARETGLAFSASFDDEDIPGCFDLCIASPGIPPHSSFYANAAAASGEVVSEIEFAWRESAQDSLWLAVTGTNGKTTTTALSAFLLTRCGFAARAVGNIGDVALDAVAEAAAAAAAGIGAGAPAHATAGASADAPAQVYVAEVSSYQLNGTRLFAPDAAILLNITPDHLSWHGSMDNYIQAKYRVLANLRGAAVLDATDPLLRGKMASCAQEGAAPGAGFVAVGCEAGYAAPLAGMPGLAGAAWLRDGVLCVECAAKDGAPHRVSCLCRADELRILGEHNAANALAAAAAVLSLGADETRVAEALREFAPLPHRIEPVANVGGVQCYNDSKGTNVDATLKALAAFEPGRCVLLLGGRDKGTDLAPLVEAARTRCKAVVCFGEARPRFLEAFALGAPGFPAVEAEGMESALDAALGLAVAGDSVVLSPACASFDEFSCYQERGDAFRSLSAARAARAAAPESAHKGGE